MEPERKPPERKPDVIDLTKYRKNVQDRAKAQIKKANAPKREPMLGQRPNAGMLLIVVLVALAVVFIMPRLMGAH